MAITVDVITRVVESSLKGSSDNIDRHFTATGKQVGENFSKALAEGASKSPELQKAFDKAADAAGKLRAEQEKLNAVNAKANATDAQKIAQAERVETAKRAEARAVREAAEAYERFGEKSANGLDRVNRGAASVLSIIGDISSGTRLGGITSEIGNMASGFATAGSAVGGFGASFAAAGLIAGGAVVVGLAAAASGAVALTKELYDMGAQWDNTFDNIQIKTGASGEALSQIKDAVKNVAGDVPESLTVIGDIGAQVYQQFDVTGGALEDLTKNLGNLKHMGVDVDIHSLGQVMNEFKITSEGVTPALEQLLNASQKMNVPVADLLNTMQGGSAALQQFGFNIGETLGLLETFEDAGLPPERAINAMTKAAQTLVEHGLEPTKANLQMVLGKLGELASSGDINLATEGLNELFGVKAGASWLQLIKEGKLNLEGLSDPIEAGRTSIQGLADDTFDWSESWQTMKNDIAVALEPLAAETFNDFSEILKDFAKWIKEHQPEIIGFFTFVATQAVNMADITAKAIGGMILNVGDAFEHLPLVGDWFKGVKDAGQDLVDFGIELDELQTKIQTAGDKANALAEFTRAVGDNVELLPDGKTIVLKDNTAEALARIDSTKYAIENLPDGKVKVVAKTEDASRDMQVWIDEQNGTPVEPPVKPDLKPANDAIGQWKAKLESEGVTIPIDGSLVGVPVPGSGPVTNDPFGVPRMQKFGANRYEPGMVPNNRNLMNAISSTFGVKAAADTGRRDKFGEHASGQALDIMVNPGGALGNKTAQGQMTGTQINDWLLRNAKEFGLQYTIWQGKQWNPQRAADGSWVTSPNAGQGITGGHWDHVHARVSPGPAATQNMQKFGAGGPTAGGFASLSSSITANGMKMFGPDSGSILPTGPTYAPGLEPGPVGSTPGVNEYGEPGYYRPDSDSISSAERAAQKAQDRIGKADERVIKAQEDEKEAHQRANEAQAKLDAAEAKAQQTGLKLSEEERKRLQEQLDAANKRAKEAESNVRDARQAAKDARADAEDAQGRVDDAKRGRFTPARESSSRGGRGGSGGLQIGAPLADDMGLSEGLPGLARFATTFLANLAFAPAIGALSALTGGQGPDQTGYGLMGMLFGGGGSSGTSMYPSASVGGIGGMPGLPGIPGVGPSTVASTASPDPLGGALGSAIHGGTGAPPGPGVTTQTSMQPSAGPGGGGFAGLGGLPLAGIQSAISAAAMGADAAGGFGGGQVAGAAAQMAIQLANRTAGYIGQAAAIGVGGLMETFLPHDSAVADPNKSWIGRIAAGFAGARPATGNTAGQGDPKPPDQDNPAGNPKAPQTPEEAAAQAQQQNGGQNGPMYNVENLNVGSVQDGQAMTNQMDRMAMASNGAGGPR